MLLALAVVPDFFRELLSNQDPPEVKNFTRINRSYGLSGRSKGEIGRLRQMDN